MSDKAQLAALGTHLEQQRTISTIYRAEGRRLAVAEVECIALNGRVYSAAEVIEMAQEYELIRKPLSDAEVQEARRAAAQIVARAEVVRAALALRMVRGDALLQHVIEPNNDLAETMLAYSIEQAAKKLDKAVDAFLAAGGSEVGG